METENTIDLTAVPERFRKMVDAAATIAKMSLEMDGNEIIPAFCFVIDKEKGQSLANMSEFMTPEFAPIRRQIMQSIIKERDAQLFGFMSEGWMVETPKDTDIDELMDRNKGSLANDDRRVSCVNIHCESDDGDYCALLFRINEKATPRSIDWMKPDHVQSGNYKDGVIPVEKMTRAMDLFDTVRRAA